MTNRLYDVVMVTWNMSIGPSKAWGQRTVLGKYFALYPTPIESMIGSDRRIG